MIQPAVRAVSLRALLTLAALIAALAVAAAPAALARATLDAGEGSDEVNLVDDVHGVPIDVWVSKDFDQATGGPGDDVVWMHSADAIGEFETAHVSW